MTTVRDMFYVDDVLTLLKCGRTTLWRMVQDKQFPQGHVIRGRRVWYADELAAWQDTLPPWERPRRKQA